MNLEPIIIREQIIRGMRDFFYSHAFHEVVSPVLNYALPLEPTLYSFTTTWNPGVQKQIYLSVSPEAGLKKMLAAGLGNCFSIGKSFRNLEGSGPTHNPEFLMLEWYRENADYHQIMKDVEDLIAHLQELMTLKRPVTSWQVISLEQAFAQFAKVNLKEIIDDDSLRKLMGKRGYVVGTATWEQLFDQLFLNEVEPNLPKTSFFLTDFPAKLSPLCKVNSNKPYLAERFEVYLDGMEIGNGNNENLDAENIYSHFRSEEKIRKIRGESIHPIDNDFIKALEQMRSSGKKYAGIGMGVDRLAIYFAGVKSIQEVEPFCL